MPHFVLCTIAPYDVRVWDEINIVTKKVRCARDAMTSYWIKGDRFSKQSKCVHLWFNSLFRFAESSQKIWISFRRRCHLWIPNLRANEVMNKLIYSTYYLRRLRLIEVKVGILSFIVHFEYIVSLLFIHSVSQFFSLCNQLKIFSMYTFLFSNNVLHIKPFFFFFSVVVLCKRKWKQKLILKIVVLHETCIKESKKKNIII